MTMTTDILRQTIVVFSKNYLPTGRVNIKRAITLLVTGKAEPLDLDDEGEAGCIAIHSATMVMLIPPQIRLTITHKERTWKVPAVNRREVLRRDKHTCQYCGSTKRLTLDHVIPRSRFGKHSWDNVVTACERCNSLKGNRTPEEANMKLMTQPKAPEHPVMAFAEQFWREHKNRMNQH